MSTEAADLPPAGFGQRYRTSARLETIALYAGSVAVALLASALLVAATGGSWAGVFSALVEGSLSGPGRWGDTLTVAAPLVLVALGTVVNARAGLVNIGQEGQLLIGAAFATYFATRLGGPGPVVLLVFLAVGIVGGALWAGIAALLRYWRKVPEVLTTLLLVTVSFQLVGFGLKTTDLLLDPDPNRPNRNQVSAQLADDSRLPNVRLFGNEFPVSVLAAAALAVVVALVLARTTWGFRLRMLGRSPRTARRAGVSDTRFGAVAMLISGAFCGLAGGFMLAGGVGDYQLTPGFSTNFGWTGLLVALVARERPIAALPVAFVFASLRTGSGFLAATGVERKIVDVVQALLVLALLVPPAILFLRERRRALALARART